MIKREILLIFIFLLFTPLGFSVENAEKKTPGVLQTVSKVDLNRYLGVWYEIAKIPNRFQKKCSRDTTAEYKLRADGRIDVINRCVDRNGKQVVARGIGKVMDSVNRSKLKVSFVRVLGLQFFWGDYWIIGLGEDYGYAVVGEPKRKYGWILSRRNHLSSEEWQSVNSILTAQGYDPRDFVQTVHTQKK